MGTLGHEAEEWADIVAMDGEDIGYDIRIIYIQIGDVRAGLLLYHHHKNGSVCGGSVHFAMPYGSPSREKTDTTRALWKVESIDPLTLSPSIEDKTCSEHLHGYIVNGRWKPV
jgi:hypothetical protein